jgi:hypothetical protein
MRILPVLLAAATLAVMLSGELGAQTLDSLPFAKKLKLAKVGDEEAQMAVAHAYETGEEAKQDAAEAAKWYRMAAEQGNLEAQFRLGRLVQEGAPGLKKNAETAAKLYEGAAKQGHSGAQNWLGYCYQHGLGVPKSDENAMLWYKRAADSGLAEAQNNLGLMYLNGKGSSRDLNKAYALFDRAAKQGDDWGLNNLGGMYEMGWGVAQDKQKALDLYRQSLAKGNSRAKDNLDRLTALLGKADKQAAPQKQSLPADSATDQTGTAASTQGETKTDSSAN